MSAHRLGTSVTRAVLRGEDIGHITTPDDASAVDEVRAWLREIRERK